MFEFIPSFWTILISFLTGVLTISATLRLATSRKKKIVFDSYSYNPAQDILPAGIDFKYKVDGDYYSELFINRVFIKNETGEALASTTLIEPVSIRIEGAGKLMLARLVAGPDPSRASPVYEKSTDTVMLNDLIIPVDGAVEIELVTEHVVNPVVRCTHTSAKLVHRYYGGLVWSNSLLMLTGLISLLAFMLLDSVLRATGYQGMLKPLNDISRSLTGFGSVLFFLSSMALPFVFATICAYSSRFFFPMMEAEKKFAKRKHSE